MNNSLTFYCETVGYYNLENTHINILEFPHVVKYVKKYAPLRYLTVF